MKPRTYKIPVRIKIDVCKKQIPIKFGCKNVFDIFSIEIQEGGRGLMLATKSIGKICKEIKDTLRGLK